MASARAGHTATLLASGLVLVAGGTVDGDSELASAELYDPDAGTWRATAAMPEAREGHQAVLLPAGVLVLGGGDWRNGSVFPLATAAIYDPTAGTWRPIPPMSAPRHGATATLLATGKVLVTGGLSTPGIAITAELFDPATETWSAAASLAVARWGHAAVRLASGKVLVTGGETPTGVTTSSAEIYDPVTDTWTGAAALPWSAEQHSTTLLPSGQVIAAGGLIATSGTYTRVKNAALYDPNSDAWTPTASMRRIHCSHAVAMLPSGKLIVVGGGHNVTQAGSEVYDPAAGTWNDGAPLPVDPGDAPAAVRLPDGKVLLTGGFVFGSTAAAINAVQVFVE